MRVIRISFAALTVLASTLAFASLANAGADMVIDNSAQAPAPPPVYAYAPPPPVYYVPPPPVVVYPRVAFYRPLPAFGYHHCDRHHGSRGR